MRCVLCPCRRGAREEIFGPVVSVVPFDTEDEALGIANDTMYGLAAAVRTRDLGRARRMSRDLRSGTVWINNFDQADLTAPFGGFKLRSRKGRPLIFEPSWRLGAFAREFPRRRRPAIRAQSTRSDSDLHRVRTGNARYRSSCFLARRAR
jgi:hypothetical protein